MRCPIRRSKILIDGAGIITIAIGAAPAGMIGRTRNAEVEVVKILGPYWVHLAPVIGPRQLVGCDPRRRYRSGQGQRERGGCKQFEVCHDGSPSELASRGGWLPSRRGTRQARARMVRTINARYSKLKRRTLLKFCLIVRRQPNSKALDSIYPTG